VKFILGVAVSQGVGLQSFAAATFWLMVSSQQDSLDVPVALYPAYQYRFFQNLVVKRKVGIPMVVLPKKRQFMNKREAKIHKKIHYVFPMSYDKLLHKKI
jgi:hypothetical protein